MAYSFNEQMRTFITLTESRSTDTLESIDLTQESIIAESSLSKLIGDSPGGQNLVRFLHRKNLLSNTADFVAHPFDARFLWTSFKDHPDKFVILLGTEGIAGVKPNESDIRRGIAKAESLGMEYDPSRDNTINYQIVAFKKDERIDPELLKPAEFSRRGGMINKKDVRNPNNMFDLMSAQIGRLNAIYTATDAVERSKIATRDVARGPIDIHKRDTGDSQSFTQKHYAAKGITVPPQTSRTRGQASAAITPHSEIARVFDRINPVISKIAYSAIAQAGEAANAAHQAGDTEAARAILNKARAVKGFANELKTSSPENSKLFLPMVNAIAAASGHPKDSQEFAEWLHALSTSGPAAYKPVVSAIKSALLASAA